MSRYEYEITSHPADSFREVVYFCSENGTCDLGQIPSGQVEKMKTLLNERGRGGWELVQMAFGKEGVMAFWKRVIIDIP
ncbi:hypothetical protein [Desulforhabdus sp. TSK]|uniref:hypothetical protein n=1 Tax=Desulforhabdus sp. TSK TaxID=2925014 RepID=UPI001FC81A24|nr:hypothetical protein [Desulforhabdus sp. TSK]GKT08451.1 hypothetical protein DSTSK_17560 [Desulforhabdus sp. TSK]